MPYTLAFGRYLAGGWRQEASKPSASVDKDVSRWTMAPDTLETASRLAHPMDRPTTSWICGAHSPAIR